jgi:hypothetical protein
MKFFLIANNVNLTNEIIDNLDIKYDDYIILFNHQFPMKYTRISNHKNKIIFIRTKINNSEEFNGIEQLKQNYKEFEKIYIVCGIYKNYSSSIISIKNKLNDDNVNVNLYQLPSEVFAYIETIDIPLGKSCTTGLYAYIFFNYYYDNRNKIDKIVLVGFDLNYPNGIRKSHSDTFELDYYNNELTKNNKLIKIESSKKSLNDSEISENYQYNKYIMKVNRLKKKLRNNDFRLEKLVNTQNVIKKTVVKKKKLVNFFLIANNVKLTSEIIDNLDIKYDDYIILFNHQFPMKYTRISNHKNKIIFIRKNGKNSEDFNGIEQLKQNYKEFEKIYTVRKYYENKYSSIIIKNKLNDDNVNVDQLPSKLFAYIKNLDIPLGKSCTTGLYAYIFFNYYYDNRNKIDKIVLVGFDLNYPNGLIINHSANFELNYYNNELTKNNKLIKIESSKKSLNDSEISENYQYNKDNMKVNDLFRLENKNNLVKLFLDFILKRKKSD